ncbi:short-chain dehydrogenase [Caulobacter sp. Root1455]|uniref:NnrS family protein n=1 Tax=unclassified Caulobacter TaxID=2648921 RepID=UPI0006FF6DA6|nr:MULTISPECIES: NnrS family protein [unclassified Caulobacter]KQY26459.1 short-chain dehydrogenase [Caulobacter sp. Root487D2Y]KQY91438.1 short-chain dehydrogenase [Caulobacter sp. Root1455]
MSTAAARRAYRGPAFFSFGFRPFYLMGALWSALVVPLWLWSYLAGGPGMLTRDWHVHEMLFGFLAAVIAGFLTTAVPNWTGRMPIIGAPLAQLAGLWLAGRVAMLFQASLGAVATGVIDSLFLVVFAGVIWREVLAGRNWRNLPVCGLVTALALGNIAFHVHGVTWASALGERLALGVAALLIALIGGRITPSFTRNWLKARGAGAQPAVFDRIDQAALALTGVAAASWAVLPDALFSGALLALAGLTNLVRLARWSGWATRSEPLVWVLHLGYGWLGLSLLLLGASVLDPAIPRTAGIHALTAGAVGVMTLAVMTRSSRGHSGRDLHADAATTAVYVAINAAAVARVAAPFTGLWQQNLLMVSAFLWILAFAGFAASYGPMLVLPRPLRA